MPRARDPSRRRRLDALDRLRLRIGAWYVATCAAILLVLGTGLFFVVAAQIKRELDATLAQAARALASADAAGGLELRVPGIELYITDSLGRPLHPGSASTAIMLVARQAVREGVAVMERPASEEHVLRLHARAFRSADGTLRVAVASADLEDLEDRYLLLITQFAVAAVVALWFVALGGLYFGREFAQPVETVIERMRQFMSDAAHELRTPVTVLRTESEVALGRARAGEEDEAAFRRIAGQSARLAEIVDDLFLLARAESGELPIERASVFMDDIASDAVSAMGSAALRCGVSLQLGEFEEARVDGSATLLRRVIVVLLDNALKYTAAGGRVTVSTTASDHAVQVEVADNGIGIASEALPHVFDRFYRSDAARGVNAGSGLGLAIARRISELHDGRLTIESVLGRGTTVRLELPRLRDEDGPPAEDASM